MDREKDVVKSICPICGMIYISDKPVRCPCVFVCTINTTWADTTYVYHEDNWSFPDYYVMVNQ